MKNKKEELKSSKKKKFKRRYWFVVDLAVAVIVVILLLYKPGRYEPIDFSLTGLRAGQVHPYWTYLSSKIYNGAQFKEPFDVVVLEEKINEAIAGWSEASEGVVLYKPAALFVPDRIVLMATADVKGVELVVTIELEAGINEEGLLNLRVAKMKVGAMNITPIARMMARKMYADKLSTEQVDRSDLGAQIAGALLEEEPFEPVFPAGDNEKVRLEKIIISKKKLILHLVPILYHRCSACVSSERHSFIHIILHYLQFLQK